jgi:hypothetical protein
VRCRAHVAVTSHIRPARVRPGRAAATDCAWTRERMRVCVCVCVCVWVCVCVCVHVVVVVVVVCL